MPNGEEWKSLLKRILKKIEDKKERLSKVKNWFALDMFFGKINEEIIEPLESEVGRISLFNPLLKISEKFNKSLIKEFLRMDRLKSPEYLETTDNEKLIKKMLDYLFLWYDINVLDTQKLTVFNGVPAFVSTLLGNIEFNRIFGVDEKILVLRFKHPVEGVGGYDYSYGILIQAFGSTGITDYSGWLVFFDCANDCSGFGGSLHHEAELFIEKSLESEKIDIKEYVVDKELFKEYLAEKSVTSVFDRIRYPTPFGPYTELSISEIQRKMEDFAGDAKGKFFEYLFFKWLIDEEGDKYKKIKCDITVNREQIDVFAETENEVYIFECKINLHSDEKIVEQIERKVKAMNSKKSIHPYLVVFSQIQDIYKEKFRNKGIQVSENFELKVENWRELNRNSKNVILRILKFRGDTIFEEYSRKRMLIYDAR